VEINNPAFHADDQKRKYIMFRLLIDAIYHALDEYTQTNGIPGNRHAPPALHAPSE
jgi:hypothetical protein